MIVTLNNLGESVEVDIPFGSTASVIRTLRDELEEIGAQTNSILSVNGTAVEDGFVLPPGAQIGFRPVSSDKGAATR